MRALKVVKIEAYGKECECVALFDTGSGVTAIQRKFYEENFGRRWLNLDKPIKVFWLNEQSIDVDKYAQATIIIDEYRLPEVVFVIDEWVEKIRVDEKEIKLPEMVIGSGTMDKYGISLDPKEGVRVLGASLLFNK